MSKILLKGGGQMFTIIVSFEEALMLGMLSGDYTVVASIEDLFGNELLVMRRK